jgi:hypothetical protein
MVDLHRPLFVAVTGWAALGIQRVIERAKRSPMSDKTAIQNLLNRKQVSGLRFCKTHVRPFSRFDHFAFTVETS